MNAFKWSCAAVLVAVPLVSSASWLDGRPYIGAGASYSIYDNLHDLASDRDTVTRQRITKNAFGFAFVGGWTFPGNYSLEIGYTDFGDFEVEELISYGSAGSDSVKVDGSMTGKSLGVRYDWLGSDNMNLYGRVGVMRWEMEWDTVQRSVRATPFACNGNMRQDCVGRSTSDTDGSDFYVGVGGQYELMPNFFAYIEGYMLDAEFDKDGFGSDQRVFAVYGGLRFRLGAVARASGTTDKRTREVTACDPKYKDISGVMCEQ